MTPPNVVLIMADQHRADVMRCAGDGFVSTPNLDRLAEDGVRFSRVSCQGPLCMPARASFLTERYVRDHGVYTNWAEVAPGTPTYVQALQGAGYYTVALGKQHLTRDEELDVAHQDDLAPSLRARGFDEVQESGDKFSLTVPNRYSDYLRARGLWDAYLQHLTDRSYQGERETGRGATKKVPMWDATPTPLPLADYIDSWHGRLASDWISAYDRADPFYAFVGFPGPHDPWDAPAEAVAEYASSGTPALPRSTRRPDPDGTGNYGKLLAAFGRLSDTDTMTDDGIVGMRRAYAANVSVIDHEVGRILDALDDRGVLDDTWVIYTSDHGEMAGDHGHMSKCVLYDGAVRVPLLVRPPRGAGARSGSVVDDLVEHVDVPATIRAATGAGAVPDSEGRSLLGYVSSDAAPPEARALAISENWGFASFETHAYKLVVDEDALVPAQLFDRVNDPNEDENLITDAAAAPVVGEMMDEIVKPFLATPPVRNHKSFFTS